MQKYWLHNVVKKTVPLEDYGTLDLALTSLMHTWYMALLNVFRETFSLLMLVPPYQASLFSLPFNIHAM